MKKLIAILMILFVGLLAACSESTSVEEWERIGYYQDENGNMLSVSISDIEDREGLLVSLTLGDRNYENVLELKGKTLQGNLAAEGEDEMIVKISEAASDGLKVEVKGGETYRFAPMDMTSYEESEIDLEINVDGQGFFAFTEGSKLEAEPDYTWTSTLLSFHEPAVYTLDARAADGWEFVKWTRDGSNYSATSEITIEVTESAVYTAVFASE